jgi:hypothetical protein
MNFWFPDSIEPVIRIKLKTETTILIIPEKMTAEISTTIYNFAIYDSTSDKTNTDVIIIANSLV